MDKKYPKPVMMIHWLTFMMVLLAYFTGGNPIVHPDTGQFHVIFGMLVMLLFFIRIIFLYWFQGKIPKSQPINRFQNKIFHLVKYMLYLCLFLIPLLGWLTLSGLTDDYHLYGMHLPLLTSSFDLSEIGEFHEFLANLFMLLIGFHAFAALVHHYLFKDNVLKSMFYLKK